MNYKQKYLKYKLKYLNIKKNNNNIKGGGIIKVYDWNMLKTPGNDEKLIKVINDIKESPVVIIVGHGEIEPQLDNEKNVENLDLKSNIVIGMSTFDSVIYNHKFINNLNVAISKELKNNDKISKELINIIQKKFAKTFGENKFIVYEKKMPIKNFYLNLTRRDDYARLGIYYYTEQEDKDENKKKINLLEYRYHNDEDLRDIINRFSNESESKIFVIYSCHVIPNEQINLSMNNSPIRLTAQREDGKKAPEVIPDFFELPESVSHNFSAEKVQVIPADGIPNNQEDKIVIQEDEIVIQEDEILPQNKSKKKQSTEECETCNKSFCNIQ